MKTKSNLMKGQISDAEFKRSYPRVTMHHDNGVRTCVTQHGNTTNYWIQHDDGSWTNYDCKTKY